MFLSTVSVSFSNFIQVGFGFVFRWMYDLTSNYALTLVLFGVLVKLIMLPMSAKQKKTSMKTARLAPQLKVLEAQCGDDKNLYQQEVANLYKEEGVSMPGMCLWSFVPMFFLIPLYYVIREPLTYVMRWDMTDILAMKAAYGGGNAAYWQLEAAHAVHAMDFSMFGINLATTPSWHIWEANSWDKVGQFLIPVVSAGINLLQMIVGQKLNASLSTDDRGETDEEAAALANKSSKTMTYMMPAISLIFGFMWPAGMSIYWITQGLFSVVQDIVLTKHYRKVYDAEDKVKRDNARQRAAEEAEKERIRAQRRAENPNGITANTSKKKLEQQKAAEREQAAREFAAKNAPAKAEKAADAPLSGDPERPYSRGRAYQPDRYAKGKDKQDENSKE